VIISFPTALYSNLIPGVGDTGNVTWLISSTDPPRSVQSFQQIPSAEFIRRRDPPVYNDQQRRAAMGDAVFSLSQGSQSVVGSAVKQFEVGQVLDFTGEELAEASQTAVPEMIDVQQNTNLLDLSALGLSEVEIKDVVQAAEEKKKKIEDEIVALLEKIDDVRVGINENQKRINEANKVLDAAVVVEDAVVVSKMQIKITDLSAQRNALIATLNSYNADVKVKYDQLLQVIQLVR